MKKKEKLKININHKNLLTITSIMNEGIGSQNEPYPIVSGKYIQLPTKTPAGKDECWRTYRPASNGYVNDGEYICDGGYFTWFHDNSY